jgi:uncharacterized protein (DUF1330 family)
MGERIFVRTYHQLVFIWIRDPAMFAEYLRELPPIVARYGGAADLSLRPTTIWADGLTQPDIVNLVHYDDRAAYQRFNSDPDFMRIEPLRAGSVDLLTYEGYLTTSDPSAGAPGRVYNVELAGYRDRIGEAYRTYEERGEARMREYGYHIEYVLAAETAPAGRPRPDLIKISSFPDEAARTAFDADPAHGEIEEKLYPAATDHVIWLTAHALA